MKTQLCLLSGELMPNLIGVLHSKADQIIPVVTRESEKQVASLARALAAVGSRAQLLEPIPVLPYDLADCLSTIRAAAHALPGLEINWTAGTKIMSYAARAVAAQLKLHSIYVNTAQRQIIREQSGEMNSQVELFDSAELGLNVFAHLAAAGHTVGEAETLEQFQRRFTPSPALVKAATLILDARPWESYELDKLSRAFDKPYAPTRLPGPFIKALGEASLLQPSSTPGAYFLAADTLLHPFHLQAPQDVNSIFLRSTFLEVFLWSQIKDRSATDDVAWHVVLNAGQTGRVAEIDVAVVGEGRFLVLECKRSLSLSDLPELIEEQSARSRRIGRLFGSWILYIHQFRSQYNDGHAAKIIASQEAKAQEYGGKLLWHDDLPDLPIIVADFLTGGAVPL